MAAGRGGGVRRLACITAVECGVWSVEVGLGVWV